MEYILSDQAKLRIEERSINPDVAENVLATPDSILEEAVDTKFMIRRIFVRPSVY